MTSSTLLALNGEWAELVARSGATMSGWSEREPVLGVAADFGAVLPAIAADPDAVLAALLRLGASGESLAHRVVLQALLGKAVVLSAGRDEVFAEAVSELWLAIAEYPVQRRPRCIAANLSWMLRRRLATAAVAEVPRADVSMVSRVDPAELSAEQTLAMARSLRLIDEVDHRTLWLVYVGGLSSARAGEALGVSAELVRYRCSRSLRRLAARAQLLTADGGLAA